MFRCIWLLLCPLFALASTSCTHGPVAPAEPSDRVTVEKSQIQNLHQASQLQKNLKQSLVRLRLQSSDGNDSFGTGFFFKNRNLLVTALHTLEQSACLQNGECELMVGLVDSASSVHEVSVIAKVALRDPSSDLLFLEIKDSVKLSNIRPLQRASLPPTEQITAVGFYQDSPALTFSHGSSKSQAPLQKETLTTIIVSKGFSGAPVVNSKGELIGVVSSYHPLAANKDIGIARFVDIK